MLSPPHESQERSTAVNFLLGSSTKNQALLSYVGDLAVGSGVQIKLAGLNFAENMLKTAQEKDRMKENQVRIQPKEQKAQQKLS